MPVRTIHSGPNPRYFGQERGVTYYNLTSDQLRSSAPSGFNGLGGIVVPGTLRDSLVLLSVLLGQETALQPTEVMTDTGAYTDVMFGNFHLLGFQFSPRLADIGVTRFWRVDPKPASVGSSVRAGAVTLAAVLRPGRFYLILNTAPRFPE